MIVDSHAHFLPHELVAGLRAEPRLFPNVKLHDDSAGPRFSFAGGDATRPVIKKLSDVDERRKWLAAQKIDRQVVGGWLDIFGYELPAEEGADWCRFMNGKMLESCKAAGELAPLACVPLQNGKLAAAVLEEALSAGFHGVMIGTQPQGSGGELDSPGLTPFWEAVSARKATVFVHPMLACCDARLSDYDLVNSVGRILDTTTAVARLLFSGHFDRYPDINLIVSHGGAALPFILGRIERSGKLRTGYYADPVAAFRKLYFDTVVFDVRALRFLCEMAGADKVLLGSDHPFHLSDGEPRRLIEQSGLSHVACSSVLGETAARLFRLR
ncbi:MAG: amidohydrolase [Bradyrhizobiaceae bacterium]|nr:amidohydrolase [Bradyrhizobiaceae bacterium]